MLPRLLLLFFTISLVSSLMVRAVEADDIVGIWYTDGGESKVEVYKCGEQFCGKIIWLEEPNYADEDPMAGKPKVDRENPDESKQGQPIIGLEIMQGFQFDGEEWVEGEIYDPEKGKTYSCYMALKGDGKKLKVRGFVGVSLLGRTTYWKRAQ